MSIRRKLAATGATVALVIGGVLAATPAHAASFSQLFGSKTTCKVQTAKKVIAITRQKPSWVKVRYVCKRGDGGYYGTSISWDSR